MFNKELADKFITGKSVKKVKCSNEEKPIKILEELREDEGVYKLTVYNGEAHWDGEKWTFFSNFAMLADIIMNRR